MQTLQKMTSSFAVQQREEKAKARFSYWKNKLPIVCLDDWWAVSYRYPTNPFGLTTPPDGHFLMVLSVIILEGFYCINIWVAIKRAPTSAWINIQEYPGFPQWLPEDFPRSSTGYEKDDSQGVFQMFRGESRISRGHSACQKIITTGRLWEVNGYLGCEERKSHCSSSVT